MLGRIEDPNKRLAAGFVLSIFQKMNASSNAAIRSALEKRKNHLLNPKKVQPKKEDEFEDSRYEGELEEKSIDSNQQAIIDDEVNKIDKLLKINVKQDKKIDELFKLIKWIDKESPKKEHEKVLIFTEYH